MATIAEDLAAYGHSLHFQDLPSEVVHLAKRFIIDTIACGLGGFDSEPSRVAREMAGLVSSTVPAMVMGSGQTTSVDMATFANGVMMRYLDFNDTYSGKESGHPSDSIAAALSATQAAGGGGRRMLVSTVLAYETFCRIADGADLKPRGFDHVTIGGIASTMAAARAMQLSEEQTLQALNLGIAPNLALYQTRIGDVSMWKGCAYANASRNGVFAAMLAQRGLTGPSPIFEGGGGYFHAVSGGPFELGTMGGGDQPFKLGQSSIKRFPLGQFSQTVAQAGLDVREQVPSIMAGAIKDVAEVNISTLQTAITIMANDPEKWKPTNRETADHSMPYVAAVSLMFGTVESGHFGDEYLANQELLDLVSKVKITVSEEANRQAPEAMLCDMEVVTTSGQRFSAQVAHHKGHFKNPISDAELEVKFRSLAKEHLSEGQTDALLGRLWHLEDVDDVGEIIKLTCF